MKIKYIYADLNQENDPTGQITSIRCLNQTIKDLSKQLFGDISPEHINCAASFVSFVEVKLRLETNYNG